ncbi:rna-binding protein [Aspergillus luchuensis]|uniref:Rna-binding protein n=1 Tax=Aspergillus kawachii TaxID=1069201 RepID=A0A146FFS3_ASPKA|nr:rna-binding protein [Aspergillus luchuensis]
MSLVRKKVISDEQTRLAEQVSGISVQALEIGRLLARLNALAEG